MNKACLLLLTLSALTFGQQSAPQSQGADRPNIKATTNEVLVDVVVRDKKGRPVRNLEPADFQIEEDGRSQKITAFRQIDRRATRTAAVENKKTAEPAAGMQAAPVQTPGTLDPTKQIRLVSLVFDRLGIDARRLAKTAAMDMLKTDAGPNTFFAVFSIDQRLKVLQQFTGETAAIRYAIDKATSGTPSDYANDNSGLRHADAATSGSDGAADAAVGGGARGPGNVDGGAMANEAMNRMIQEMLVVAENESREQQGRSTLFSLMAIVKEQFRLPGRKSVLFFAEGLQVPNTMYEQFHSVISAANRSNVSIYAIDARGLLVTGDNGAAETALSKAAKSSRSQWTKKNGDNPVTLDQVLALDRAQDSLRQNAQIAMAELAEGTGGFLMANQNDLRGSLKKIAEDMNTYYEISYSPGDDNYDGKFRKIQVKVNRSDVTVQARSGYFSLPPLDGEGQTVYPHEVPLLKALARRPLPHAIEYHASFLKFKPEPTELQTVLAFDVPLSQITFVRDKEHNTYRTHVSILVMLKDEHGKILKKYSRDVPLEGSLDKLEAFQQGHFIYTRPMILPLGRLTLETAVLDQEGERISANRSVYFARGASQTFGLSNLTLIRRVEPMSTAPDPLDPLEFSGGKITPSLVETVKVAKGAVLPLYFVVYPQAGSTEKPDLTMEFVKDGQLIARATPQLPTADTKGSIPYVADTPIETFPPGDYEIRVTLRQGSAAAQERTVLRLE